MSVASAPVSAQLELSDREMEGAITELRRMDEPTLWSSVLVPFYRRRGYRVEIVHNSGEDEHGLDLLLELRMPGNHTIFEGVQTKSKINLTTPAAVRNKVANKYKHAITYKHPSDGGTERLLNTFFWITTGEVTSRGREGVRTHIEKQTDIGPRMQVWDARALIDQLLAANCHDLLRTLKLARYESLKRQHLGRKEGLFAAHCAYLAARWHLEERKPDAARTCLREAIEMVEQDERKSFYYFRTFRTYYEILYDLLGQTDDFKVAGMPGYDGTPRSREIETYIHARYPGWGMHFLDAIAFFLDQFDLLEEQYLDSRSGLSSLQICRLLLRAGRSPEIGSPGGIYPTRSPLAGRLDAIRKEVIGQGERMKQRKRRQGYASIDDECSLCTGTALSCLMLANRRDECKPLVDWLASLHRHRFAYQFNNYDRTRPEEQALHYAATVMEGFHYYEHDRNDNLTRKAIAILLRERKTNSRGFYVEWMRFRNIDTFEVCTFILSGFLVLSLGGHPLEAEHREALRETIRNLAEQLVDEAREADMSDLDKPAKLYAVRENVGSLSLGVLLGVDNDQVESLLRNGLFHFYHRSQVVLDNKRPSRDLNSQYLMDSAVDRTRGLLEAWIQFWEVFHLRRELGDDLTHLLPVVPARGTVTPSSRRVQSRSRASDVRVP